MTTPYDKQETDSKYNQEHEQEHEQHQVQYPIDSDPWNHWSNGPMLRKDSFTARQLIYLTPEAVSLENRKVFIGDFPEGWIESNGNRWFQTIRKRLERLASRHPHIDNPEAASNFVTDELQRIAELRLAAEIAGETDNAIRDQTTRGKKLIKAMRKRRLKFRHHKLPQIDIDSAVPVNTTEVHSGETPSDQESKAIEGQRDSRIDSESLLSSIYYDCDESLPDAPAEIPHITATTPGTSQQTSRDGSYITPATTSENNTTEGKRGSKSCVRVVEPEESPIELKEASYSATDPDGDNNMNLDTKSAVKSKTKAETDNPSRKNSMADVVRSYKANFMGEKTTPGLTPQESAATTSGTNSHVNSRRGSKVPFNPKFPTRFPHLYIPKSKVKPKKIFQGRFLVQERKSRSGKPVVNETESPLGTQLVTRWKECAILAKQTTNPDKPLVLYFYETGDKGKRTSKHRWMQSSAFKIPLDSHYETALFSPLDLTLALWRPRLKGEKKHAFYHPLTRGKKLKPRKKKSQEDQERGRTHILLIHSQSLSGIMDLAFLLTSATRGTPWIHGSSKMNVNVPSVGASLQIETNPSVETALEELQESSRNKHALLSYYELLEPAVAKTAALKGLIDSMWNVVSQMPRRYNASADDNTNKFTLAWVLPGLEHRPLWMGSTPSSTFPTSWMHWIMNSSSSLSLVQPRPRCYELTNVEEPVSVEGYCSRLFVSIHTPGSPYSKPVFSSKRNCSQYLFTADHYLIYALSQDAEPPMLASNQNTVEKVVEPYPLDKDGHIAWLKLSTCLHEVDFHDLSAKLEYERREKLIMASRGFIDLRFFSSFVANDSGDVEIFGFGDRVNVICFGSKDVAALWAKRLQSISNHWKQVHKARNVRRAAGTVADFSITPFLQNRSIVYSGSLFMKNHRFATFKAFHVLLTNSALVVFKIDQKRRPPAHPNQNLPSGASMYQHYQTIDLQDSYVYTGQAASHVLLDDDSHLDPSNPGVRALPRAYEDGWITQDTELERCFVLWRNRNIRFPVFHSSGEGSVVAFLAQERFERDKWSTAIRHVLTSLAAKREDDDDGDDLGLGSALTSDAESDNETT